MKHAVILAHPRPRSFVRLLAQTYLDAVRDHGCQAELIDLYDLDFDPRLRAEEIPGPVEAEPRRNDLRRGWRSFLTAEVGGAAVTVTVAEQRFPVAADRSGIVDVRLPNPGLAPGWHTVGLDTAGRGLGAAAAVLAGGAAGHEHQPGRRGGGGQNAGPAPEGRLHGGSLLWGN